MEDLLFQIEEYAQGKRELAQLEQSIDTRLTDGAAHSQIYNVLNDALTAGQITPPIHELLVHRVDTAVAKAAISRTTAGSRPDTSPGSVDDATRIRPKPGSVPVQFDIPGSDSSESGGGDDATRVRTTPNPAARTARRTQTGRNDATQISTNQPASMPRTDASAASSFVPTGSNWANPELWKEHNPGPIEPGSIIKGRFLIEEQLGKGGMGTVFKARDNLKIEAQDSDPFVAIKILNKEFSKHPKAMISLQREAKKAQTLAHPNIITVYDFDRDGTTVFMHMELMRGESLSKFIKRNRPGGVSRKEALPIIGDMAAGLAYAHENGIVHSDFKPGNVFITEENRVKVLDFGIARASRVRDKDGKHVNPDAVFDAGDLGAMTPTYASLEMLNNEDPHPSDDVYALAVTTYQLLTGKHPYDRNTAAEALEKNLVPAPIKGLKRSEWRAISKGLELKRADRITDAKAFLRKFHGPRPITKSIAALIAVLFIVASVFAYRSFQPEGPAIPFSQLPAETQSKFTQELDAGALSLRIGDIDGAWEYYSSAYELHPRNAAAINGLEQIARGIMASATNADNKIETDYALQMIERVSANPYMADHKGLRQAKKNLLKKQARQ